MRKRSNTDFTVTVDEVGQFVFGRRSMQDEIRIQVEYARLIDGVEPTDWLATVSGWLSTFKVLMVSAPEGWDVDQMDPLDDDTYRRLALVHSALRTSEDSFRGRTKQPEQAAGEGAVQDD
jgi:hypothetical protein